MMFDKKFKLWKIVKIQYIREKIKRYLINYLMFYE
jgi:hypothetical protein